MGLGLGLVEGEGLARCGGEVVVVDGAREERVGRLGRGGEADGGGAGAEGEEVELWGALGLSRNGVDVRV